MKKVVNIISILTIFVDKYDNLNVKMERSISLVVNDYIFQHYKKTSLQK